MARVANKIKLIDGSREALKLSIRITDLWFIGIPKKSEQAEMVVVDYDVFFLWFFYYILYYWPFNQVFICFLYYREMKSMLFANRISWSLARLVWRKIWLMWCIILKLWRMTGNSEFVIMNINYVLLELLLLGNLIWNTYLLGNSNLLIFLVSLLVIFKLDSWLVRSFFAICGLILIEVLMTFQIRCVYLVVALDVIGVVDEVVFRYVSSKNTRVVFKLKDLRLSFTI